jgi:VWFA-related protein
MVNQVKPTNRRVSSRSSLSSSVAIFCLWIFLAHPGMAAPQAAQPQSAQSQTAQPQAAQPAAPAQSASSTPQLEVETRDEAATFKVNVRLVVVRVVVRDSQGHAVGNLHKEDFQLFDERKPQVITQFSVEQPGTQLAREQKTSESPSGQTPAKAPDVAERFIAYVFDDVHLKLEDLMRVRDAADHHFAGLKSTDRAAIFTISGQGNLDFTDDRAQLHAALLKIQPRPLEGVSAQPCPFMSHYMADLIINKNDPQVLDAATRDAFACTFSVDPNARGVDPQLVANEFAVARNIAQTTAMHILNVGDDEARLTFGVLKDVMRRMSAVPGQRNVVLVSPGFLSVTLLYDLTDVIDRALHANVIVGTLDARGLYVPASFGDASGQNAPNVVAAPEESQYESAAAFANDDVLATLADATGGAFVHNSNDLEGGLGRVASAPEYYYVLGFSPQNLKFDGRFHNLKIALKNPAKLALQSRKGYFAPDHIPDASEEAKHEIEDALFSQEEMHDLPVQLHTQFFKSTDLEAKLTVLVHVDVKHLHFRKAEGRNRNDLTVVSGLFDRNGSFITGTEKVVEMRLKDDTLERKLESGFTLKSSFDVKPGSYLVRLVVRDTEGQLSAENGAIEIP